MLFFLAQHRFLLFLLTASPVLSALADLFVAVPELRDRAKNISMVPARSNPCPAHLLRTNIGMTNSSIAAPTDCSGRSALSGSKDFHWTCLFFIEQKTFKNATGVAAGIGVRRRWLTNRTSEVEAEIVRFQLASKCQRNPSFGCYRYPASPCAWEKSFRDDGLEWVNHVR